MSAAAACSAIEAAAECHCYLLCVGERSGKRSQGDKDHSSFATTCVSSLWFLIFPPSFYPAPHALFRTRMGTGSARKTEQPGLGQTRVHFEIIIVYSLQYSRI